MRSIQDSSDSSRGSLIPAPLRPQPRPMTTSRVPAFPLVTRRQRNAWDLYAITARAHVALKEINQALAEMQAVEDPFSQHDPITPIQLGHWEMQFRARRALRRQRAIPDIAAELRQAQSTEEDEQADELAEIVETSLNVDADVQPQAASGTDASGSLGFLTALRLTPPEHQNIQQLASALPLSKPQREPAADFAMFATPKSISQRRLQTKKHVPPSLCVAPQSSLSIMPVRDPDSKGPPMLPKIEEMLRIDSLQVDSRDHQQHNFTLPIDVAAELEVLKHDAEMEEKIIATQSDCIHQPSRISTLIQDLRRDAGKPRPKAPVIDVEAELKMLSHDTVEEAMVVFARLKLKSREKASDRRSNGQYMLSPLELGTPWGGFRF